MDGLGSLVTFQSLSDGILNTGVSTIRSAIDVQKAATIAASTPMASGYIKNTGADLDPKEVQGLLAGTNSIENIGRVKLEKDKLFDALVEKSAERTSKYNQLTLAEF